MKGLYIAHTIAHYVCDKGEGNITEQLFYQASREYKRGDSTRKKSSNPSL
jgi:hypothetical protein